MGNLHYFNPEWIGHTDERLDVDVCVYGGTAAGVIAAVKAARLGRRTVLLHPGKHLGGMTTGGLGWTDFGNKHVIGGMSRQFYRDVGSHYGDEEQWQFEPHVAAAVLDGYVADADLPVRFGQYLDRVETDGRRIARVRMLGGLVVSARMFIDATYEGDLMARAGVTCAVGRESNDCYGEQLNGAQVRSTHQFSHPVDPWRTAGDPSSGLLPGIEAIDQREHIGEGDRRVQAYNFRICMTDDPELKIPWRRPADFDPDLYVLATRWFRGEKNDYNELVPEGEQVPRKFDVLPHRTAGGHRKTDTNNHGPVSSDFIGMSWGWPEGAFAERERIFRQHVSWQMGLYWHLATSPEIPERYREAFTTWGLAADEFTDTDHWPHQLYVREARRMVGDYVITEADCRGTTRCDDPVGMASYTMDSHNCTRFLGQVKDAPSVVNEGDVQVQPTDPYPISYRAIVPCRQECENLLVPVCLSSSHIAFGSARMEPVFMLLGESAATAAHVAIDAGATAQGLPYDELADELRRAGQVLGASASENK